MLTSALNFPEAKMINGDIRDCVRRAVLAAAAGADTVVGGPPCQAFSQTRNHCRIIEDPRNSPYCEFVRIVAKLEPLVFVDGERPRARADGSEGEDYRTINSRVATVRAQVLDAADFGVPQTRQRLVLSGCIFCCASTHRSCVGRASRRHLPRLLSSTDLGENDMCLCVSL